MKFGRFVSLLSFFSTSRLGFTYRGGPAVRNYDLRTEGREPELHAIIP